MAKKEGDGKGRAKGKGKCGGSSGGGTGLPARIIFIRHGQSIANLDRKLYGAIPNHLIKLTTKGVKQAIATGERIKSAINPNNDDNKIYHFYYSPYQRTIETMMGVAKGLEITDLTVNNTNVTTQEDTRIREIDMGNFQDFDSDMEHQVRLAYNWHYYRMPEGESGTDVENRAELFLNNLVADITKHKFQADSTVIVVTHALILRCLLKRIFNFTVEQYLCMKEPENASEFILEKKEIGTVVPSGTKSLDELYCFTQDTVKSIYDLLIYINPDLNTGTAEDEAKKAKPIFKYYSNYNRFITNANSSFSANTSLIKYHLNNHHEKNNDPNVMKAYVKELIKKALKITNKEINLQLITQDEFTQNTFDDSTMKQPRIRKLCTDPKPEIKDKDTFILADCNSFKLKLNDPASHYTWLKHMTTSPYPLITHPQMFKTFLTNTEEAIAKEAELAFSSGKPSWWWW